MVEIFNTIMQYPLEFLAGLGISGGTIYAVISLIKGVIGLITKKSTQAKEFLQQQKIADAVVNALGGVDAFCDKVASVVIEKVTTSTTFNEFKQYLEKLLVKDDCPPEIKAYIETVLSQSGSEQLKLLYEQTKATLIATAQVQITETINKGTDALEDAKNEQVEEIAQPTTKTAQKASEDEDIDYA